VTRDLFGLRHRSLRKSGMLASVHSNPEVGYARTRHMTRVGPLDLETGFRLANREV